MGGKVTKFPSKDQPSVKVPIPDGFTASTVEEEQKVEAGFVIKQDGTNNEFVWIPVSEERLAQMYTEVKTPVNIIRRNRRKVNSRI